MLAYFPSSARQQVNLRRGHPVNAEGTGLLQSHCRKVKAALVMSTVTVTYCTPCTRRREHP